MPSTYPRFLLIVPIMLLLGACLYHSTSTIQNAQGIQITALASEADATAKLIDLTSWQFHIALPSSAKNKRIVHQVMLQPVGEPGQVIFRFGQTQIADYDMLVAFYPVPGSVPGDPERLRFVNHFDGSTSSTLADNPCAEGCSVRVYNPALAQSDGSLLLAEYRRPEKTFDKPPDRLLILTVENDSQ